MPRVSRTYVCETCVEDPDLQEVVRSGAISEACDYCGRKEIQPIACEVSDVIERIGFAVNQYFTDPANFVSWNSAEGGWQGHPILDAWDVLDNIDFRVADENLMNDVADSFRDDTFADPDHWPGTPHEQQLSLWQRFKQTVKHERRYTFWGIKLDEDYPSPYSKPKRILESIWNEVRSAKIIRVLPTGTDLWRVRYHGARTKLSKASALSSPPVRKAIYPNRMSPSGIPMFYAADDFATARAETKSANRSDTRATGAIFRTLVPLNILDLTTIPEFGMFSAAPRSLRDAVKFLRAFTEDLSRPIKKDGSEHTEYVPTQVFTEFIRYELRARGNRPVHGIKYPSSKTGRGCYVLFVEQNECLCSPRSRKRPQVLEFVKASLKTIRIKR